MNSTLIKTSINAVRPAGYGLVRLGLCLCAAAFATSAALADDAVQDDAAGSTSGVASPRNAAAPRSAPTGTNVVTLNNSGGRSGDDGMFARLDRSHHGYLTRDDVAADSYLATNFDRCDANHDGRLSRMEVSTCLQQR